MTRPAAVMPQARAGWVVWLAETYPGSGLVRMPGGVTLLWPYPKMGWTAVAHDVAITTLASAKRDEQQRQWRQSLRSGVQRSLCLPGVS